MNYVDENEIKYVKKQKKSSKCRKVWQKIIRKSLGCTKEEIRRSIANSRREKERVISILYGSVFQGNRYLPYAKKWRGNTLNEIINQDERNYENWKKLKTVDNSYFCQLAFGYVDQKDGSTFGRTAKQGKQSRCTPDGSGDGSGDGNVDNNGSSNSNGDVNGNHNYNKTNVTDMSNNNKSSITSNNNNNQANGPSNRSNMVTRGRAHHSEKSTAICEKDGMFEKLNYLEKRNYRNRSKVGNYYSLNGGTRSNYSSYSNQFASGRVNAHSADNYYSVGAHDCKARSTKGRNAVGRNGITRKNPSDNPSCEPQSEQNDAMIKYKYLPTGVFYSRVSRSFIANWIDHKTKKQIKVPYKIAEFGIEKGMILAILSRNLRINKLHNALKCYDSLTNEQKDEMLQVIKTTQKSEKLFHDLLKPGVGGMPRGGGPLSRKAPPDGIGTPTGVVAPNKVLPNGRNMSNGRGVTNGKVIPNGRGAANVPLHNGQSPKGVTGGLTHQVNVPMEQLGDQTDMLSGKPDRTTEQMDEATNRPTKPTHQVDQLINPPNQLPSLSNNSPSKENEQKSKRTSIRRTSLERKKVKPSYRNSENLPTGVYFYQGSYVANWWETQQKKQFKVPFKISEHGIIKAKNLAIISRIIRSSSVQQVNSILSQIEETENITDLNYSAIATLASKYIKENSEGGVIR